MAADARLVDLDAQAARLLRDQRPDLVAPALDERVELGGRHEPASLDEDHRVLELACRPPASRAPPDSHPWIPEYHYRMTGRIRLGFLTPSSNTVLEPLTTAILDDLPEVTAHFSRFPVTEITLEEAARAQFEVTAISRAAELLAHARVDALAWSGTSSSWLGFDRDVELC